jgi:two-component sensor histidine kinase
MRAVLFLSFLLLRVYLPGQELFFNTPVHLQNLPSSETYSVFQDSKGIIWICSDAGICRYNGNTLTTFTTRDGISENVVFKAYEDNKKRIWFNTLSGYLFYYENNAFHAIAANEELKKLCNTFPVNSFFIGEGDTLYCTSAKPIGLVKIPPEHNYRDIIRDKSISNRSHIFMMTNKLHPEESIMGAGMKMTYDDIYTPIFSYNNKLIRITVREEDRFMGNYLNGKIDIHKTIYLPIGNQLSVISKNGDIKRHYFPKGISNCYVDRDNDLWISTGKGGYLYKNADLSTRPVRFLTTSSLSSILVDREGTVWVATLDKGVLQSMNKRLFYFNVPEDKAIYLQKDFNQLNISFASKKIVSLLKNDSIHANDHIKKIINSAFNLSASYIDEDYHFYATSTEIFMLDPKKPYHAPQFKKRTHVSQIIKTGKDSFLFLSASALTAFYKGREEVIIPPFPMRTAVQLKNKKILISSRNNSGIYEFKNNAFENYLPQFKELKVRINCIAEDEFENLWLATNEHGLYCYDHEKKLHHFDRIEDKINALTFDNKNQLWAGTNRGLSKFSFTKDLNSCIITRFNKQHGIPNEEIRALIEFNGKIGGIAKDVFFYFDSEHLQKNSIPPFIYIESVFINDKAYDLTQQPVVEYNKNNIHILTSLVSYRNSTYKEYLYQLKGYDNSWRHSTTGDIQYTNLSHGTYTFVVYGLNNDKVKSDQPAIYNFTIKKPFWLTWWFILLEISVTFIIIFLSVRYWKNKIEKKAREKAFVNQEISEFKMTALRSQMNPHFIFNAIGSIQHYILKNEVKQSYNYLSKFSMLIRNILNNSRQEYISLTQEINTLRLYIELEQIRFTNPFQFNIEIDETLDMEMDIPTMLIQPYIENSIWHGLMPKESGGILELAFKNQEDSMLVIIRDNGMGRQITNPEKKHASKGMSITEQRISILTSTNKKKFTTTIIDLKDENGNSIGTEVNLVIPFDL